MCSSAPCREVCFLWGGGLDCRGFADAVTELSVLRMPNNGCPSKGNDS